MSESSSRRGRTLGRRRRWGVALLIVSVLALLNRYFPVSSEYLILPLLGVGFTVWAVAVRSLGLLVPGGILMGVGFGLSAQRFYGVGAGTGTGQAVFLCCLAGGFLLITLLALIFFRSRVLWPLWPAGFIAATAIIRLMGSGWQNHLWRIQPYWPFALLVIALWLLLSRTGNNSKS
ncbi:MAG: hypothetical protein ABIV50_16320 [Opitutus sp.]